MGQLSKATQQNASASEELAATSEELSGQAEQLQQSVAFFTLGESGIVVRKGAADNVPRRKPAGGAGLRVASVAGTPAAPRAAGGSFRPY